jgi:hypothetical protein
LYLGGDSTAVTNLSNYRRTPHHDNYDWSTLRASIFRYDDDRSHAASIGWEIVFLIFANPEVTEYISGRIATSHGLRENLINNGKCG